MVDGELKELLGKDNVLESQEILESYSRDLSFTPTVRPRCVVKVEKIEQIEPLVKLANKAATTLVPISSGGPHFRGDTVPSAGRAVIVDLSGLKQIIRIDKRNRVAMVEPGVTFAELVPALEQQGLRLNMPFMPRQSKSVIGSMLEREPAIMPVFQWDAIDPLTCIEVVFGSGDSFRTGSSAGPGTLEEQRKTGQAQIVAMGPGQTDFARVVQGSQGTMGIVTWASIRCEDLPSIQRPFMASANDYAKLTDYIYRLLRLRITDELLVVNNVTLSLILGQDAQEIEHIKASLPPWVLFYSLSGYEEYLAEEKVEYQVEQMIQASQQCAVKPAGALAGLSADTLLRTLSRPSQEPYWKIRAKGGCQEIFFLTTLDKVSCFVDVMQEAASRHGYLASDFGLYVQPMVQGTSCHCEFDIFYNPEDKTESAKAHQLYMQACQDLLNAGAYFSRPYGEISDMAYRRDAETTSALRKIKSIFDPNDIMNSGKLCF